MISKKLLEDSVLESYNQILKEVNEDIDPGQEEKAKQDDIADQIDQGDARNPGKVKDLEDNPEVDEEEKDLIKSKKDKEEDKFSYDIPKEIPSNIKFDDIIDQLNHVRSGASIKDDQIRSGLLKYYENLNSDEKKDLFSMLSGFATIMNKAGEAEDAPVPSDAKEKSSTKISSKVVNKAANAPIVVGEVADKYLEYSIVAESNKQKHRCVNGKMVGFGSEKSIKDINSRIEDALDFRDNCGRGTEKRSHYNGLLKYLRMQLRAAQKVNGKNWNNL